MPSIFATTLYPRSILKKISFYFTHNNHNKSFYRRLLPNHLISLNSHEGKKIFEQSLKEKNSEAFFTLIQQFVTQNAPSTCASATMAMILNSLKIDPGENWKGIWRWFDDFNIKHMKEEQTLNGLTLQQYHQLIQLNHAKSIAFSPKQSPSQNQELRQSTLVLFRSCILACCRRSNLFMTVNFHRKSLLQTGDGHFSPVAAYNQRRDMALILDVAKFKYDSYWCSVATLYEALKPLDRESNQSRGFLLNKKKYEYEKQPQSPLCLLELDFEMNRRLRERRYSKRNSLVQFLLELVNDVELHPLLIPIFYQFHTFEVAGKRQEMNGMLGQTNLKLLQTSLASTILNRQAEALLSAFCREDKLSLIIFLHLIFERSESLEREERQGVSQFLRLIRKCVVYLQLVPRLNRQGPIL